MYRLEHIGNQVYYGDSIPGLSGALMPDIMDRTMKEIGEIKPLPVYGLSTGPVQLGTYLLVSNKLNIPGAIGAPNKEWTGSAWDVGVRQVFVPEYPNYVIVTVGNADGLIFYVAITPPNKQFGTKLAPQTLKWLEEQFEDIIDNLKKVKENPQAVGGLVVYLEHKAGISLNSAAAKNAIRRINNAMPYYIEAGIGIAAILSFETSGAY